MRRGAGLGLSQAFGIFFVKSGEHVTGRQQFLLEGTKMPRPVAGPLRKKAYSVAQTANHAPDLPKCNRQAVLGNKMEYFGRSKPRGRQYQLDLVYSRTRQLAKPEQRQ